MFATGDTRGFSLIELLVVIAIIGVLAAIAIPSFLGMRDKAKQESLLASAKEGKNEIRAIKWAYSGGESFLVLDVSSNIKCFESQNADLRDTCSNSFPDVHSVGVYNNTSMEDLVDIVVDNYRGKDLASPYGVSPYLYVKHQGTVGTISISAIAGRNLRIAVYGLETSAPIYNTAI